jgi:predicted RNase H-like HicB family nuclease
MRYIALIDGGPGAYGVVFPDLPGCTAMADTLDQAMTSAAEALRDWINTVEISGNAIPAARSAEALRTDPEVSEALADGASLAAILVVRSTGKPVRANLSLDEGIVSAIDAAARKRGVTRSAMVEILARQHLPELA